MCIYGHQPACRRHDNRWAARRCAAGFTLIEMLGVLAVLAVLAGLLVPEVIRHLDVQAQANEDAVLRLLAKGIEVYVREQREWPNNLHRLTPDYVGIPDAHVGANARGFQRYFAIHPAMRSFDNADGVIAGDVPNARFLLISNLAVNENPDVSTATLFDQWWNVDERDTPTLKIYRGHLGQLFHLVSVSALGVGGSYRIDGRTVDSSGGQLVSQGTYHLVGTPVALDEADTFTAGAAEIEFSLTSDAGFQFSPICDAGSKWNAQGTGCNT